MSPSTWTRLFVLIGAVLIIGIGDIGARDAEAKVVNSDVHHHSSLAFISKFCYSDKGAGSIYFKAKNFGNDPSDLRLLIFDDTVWGTVWDRGLSCEDIRDKALPPSAADLSVSNSSISLPVRDRTRPRWWYLALSKCTGKIELEYELVLKNPGNYWYSQFSYDKQGLVIIYLLFWLLYLLTCLIAFRMAWVKWRAGTLNRVIKLFGIILLLELAAFFSLYLHEAIYGNDGVGAPGIEGFGEILQMLATLGFMAMLLVYAKGWSLTTDTLNGKKVLIAIFSVFLLSYVAFFIWENVEVDDVSTRNSYDSIPGAINQALRVLIWFYFLFCIVQSIRTPFHRASVATPSDGAGDELVTVGDPDFGFKKDFFFIVYGALSTIYFLLVPFVVLLSLAWADYYRYKVIVAVDVAITWVYQLMMLVWLFPDRVGLELETGGIWWSPSIPTSLSAASRYSFTRADFGISSKKSSSGYGAASSASSSSSSGHALSYSATSVPAGAERELSEMKGKPKNLDDESQSLYDSL